MKSLISHFSNFKSWIKLIYDTVDISNFVINEFNPTFEVQKMGNEAFQIALFGNASFPNGNKGNSCLWTLFENTLTRICDASCNPPWKVKKRIFLKMQVNAYLFSNCLQTK